MQLSWQGSKAVLYLPRVLGTCWNLSRSPEAALCRLLEREGERRRGRMGFCLWKCSPLGSKQVREVLLQRGHFISPRLGLRRQVKEHPQGFSHPLWGTRFNSRPQGQSLRHLMIFRTLSVSQEFLLYREHSTKFGSVSAYPWEDFKTWGISQRERKKLPPEPVCFFSLPHSLPPSLPLSHPSSLSPSLPPFIFLVFPILEVEPKVPAYKLSRHSCTWLSVYG